MEYRLPAFIEIAPDTFKAIDEATLAELAAEESKRRHELTRLRTELEFPEEYRRSRYPNSE
jgi:cell division protein FtsB